MDTTHTTPEVDEFALPDHIDPARWPFDEARARDATARSSYPDLSEIGRAVDKEARRRDVLAYRAGQTSRRLTSGELNRMRWQALRREGRDVIVLRPNTTAAAASGRSTGPHYARRGITTGTRVAS